MKIFLALVRIALWKQAVVERVCGKVSLAKILHIIVGKVEFWKK